MKSITVIQVPAKKEKNEKKNVSGTGKTGRSCERKESDRIHSSSSVMYVLLLQNYDPPAVLQTARIDF